MKEDRFLTVILVVIALLVVLSLAVFFIRQDEATYRDPNTPTDIVHNYILAIQKDDYARAYGYLAEAEHKPTLKEFEDFFLFDQYEQDAGIQFGEERITDDTAYVELTIMQRSGGLFFEGYDYMENARLVKQEGNWKITRMPRYSYWGWDWYEETK